MEKLLKKINNKEKELRGKLVENIDGEISSIVYELSALEEIKSIILAEVFSAKQVESKIDGILNDLSEFAYSAKFEISDNDFEYALSQLI